MIPDIRFSFHMHAQTFAPAQTCMCVYIHADVHTYVHEHTPIHMGKEEKRKTCLSPYKRDMKTAGLGFCLFVEAGCYPRAQAVLKLTILLPQPLKGGNCTLEGRS